MKQRCVPKISNFSVICYVGGRVDSKRDWQLVEFIDVKKGFPE